MPEQLFVAALLILLLINCSKLSLMILCNDLLSPLVNSVVIVLAHQHSFAFDKLCLYFNLIKQLDSLLAYKGLF